MSQYDKIKPVYFSIDHVWRHSTNVAWIAKQFALLEVGEPGLAAAAYTAGLIHDVGKVILAANFDQQYSGAHALARKQQLPLWEVEKDIFGATHGEIGAYLFGLWGMPKEVVDAVAFHHHPSRSPNQEFTPLTAVHVANVLEYDGSPNTQGLVAPVVDMDYLGRLGLRDRLDTWREAVNTSTLAPARPAPRPTQSAPPSAAALPPPAMAPEQHPVQSWDWKNPVLGMIGLGTIVCVLCLVGFLQSKRTDNDNTIEQPGPALSLKLQGPGPGTIAKKPPLLQVSTIPLATAKLLPPPVVVRPSPAELAFNDLKLQGIFFSAHRPSAIINGKLTGLNEMVDACRVLEIGPTSVTVEFQSQRRVLLLK
jgi:putative nucleotidyltransferase with HDIG domain